MAIDVPKFRPDFHVSTISGQGIFLLTETTPTVLNGAIYEAICPLIDGTRSSREIVAELSSAMSPAEIYFGLSRLEQRGFIEEADPEIPSGIAAFWRGLGQDPAKALSVLADNPVQLITVGETAVEKMGEALEDAGLRISEDADFVLVVTDDYRHPELDDIDAKMFANEKRWGLVKPTGIYPWAGPFLDPRSGGCLRCLVDRINMNYMADTFVLERSGETPVTSKASNVAAMGILSNLAAVELAKWLVTDETQLHNELVSLHITSMQLDRHKLTPRPQCHRCGETDYRERRTKFREPARIEFQSRPHLHVSDGGHRTATAEETIANYEHLVSPITGVVSRLVSVADPDHPVVHAYSASHNWATHPDSLSFMRHSLRSASGGKGTSDIQAKVGAMAEAFERYSGVFRADEIRKRATVAEMESEGLEIVEPDRVLLFSDSQYEERAEINALGNSFQIVPEPFDPKQPADWSPMWAPTSDRFVWLPTGLLYYSYSKLAPHDTPNRMAYYADSNGCAAGNSREEAALQALLELVERDAVATWWYNQVQRPKVELKDLDIPYLDELRGWLDSEGRDLWVLDITNDIGIPTFAAVSLLRQPKENNSENIVVGFGAHLDPQVGIMRSITEVNQFFASLFELGEGDLAKAFDPGAVDWWENASTREKKYLIPMDEPARRLSEIPDLSSGDLLVELQTAIRMIEDRDLEVLLLDQTRPDVEFPVMKAIVPGMRHFWSRLGEGRLFDVPVELGWLSEPVAEEDLNQTPIFF